MKHRFVSALALALTAGALSFLTGCTNMTTTSSGGGSYNPVAYKPHNPSAVRVKVSISKQQVYVMEGSKPLLVAASNIGIPAKPTPTGHFTIYRKDKDKRSGSYGFYKNGDIVTPAEAGHGSGQYIGYPMAFWCEFKPEYGFHQGYVWPIPRSHGCLRLHHRRRAEVLRAGPRRHAGEHRRDPARGRHHRRERPAAHGLQRSRPAPSYTASDRVFDSPPGGGLTPY